ncbi:TIGR01906 family membrane protein [Brevibacterium sp. 91QC2O2]|uniref:TIGR01906 family membrane protein n=1 Tax=Brevibacterium sp. 91QC2O2 TaxID=2968458 RepID=UPI00211C9B46|nr:TIGR01906 family membrane protein [Brevibacterium sp. 91QC2O2]
MASNDSKKSDDLVSQRMNSGAHDEPESAPTGAAADAPAKSDYFDDEETQAFQAFPAEPKPAKADIPAGFSSEEWGLVSSPIDADDDRTQVIPTPQIRPAMGVKRGAARTDATPAPAGPTTGGMAVVAGPATGGLPVQAAGRVAEPAAEAAGRQPGTVKRHYGFFDVVASAWLTIATPLVLLALAVRAVASGTFLKFEYFYRPGFPADAYGFSSDDRLHYASYTVDYLTNVDGARYLRDIVLAGGMQAFKDEEIAHMADVKALISLLFFLGIVGVLGGIIAWLYLSRKGGPGMRMGIRFGSILTLAIAVLVAVVALTGFDRFFSGFHQVFFSAGTWQFYIDDTLIRLFPETFWVDGAITAGLILVLGSLVLLWCSLIGYKKRRADRQELKQR